MSISNYLENQILDAVFNADVGDLPVAEVWVKLHTGDPGENCTSNAATETTRQQAAFGVASGGAVALSATIEWEDVAASETITHVSLWDAATAGNALWSGALTSSKVLNAGDTFQLTGLDVSLD